MKFCGILLITIVGCARIGHSSSRYQVLYLNSYHRGFDWSDEIFEGFRSSLHNAEIFAEYMDSKRILTGPHTELLKRIYELKYKGVHLDLVATSDDDAFRFVLHNREDLFAGIPVVFSGVNKCDFGLIAKDSLITGVCERVDYHMLIESALKLFPTTRSFYVIADQTTSGIIHTQDLKIIQGEFPHITFQYYNPLDSLTADQLLDEVERLDDKTLVYYAHFFQDGRGSFINYPGFLPRLSRACPRPIIVHNAVYVGHGVLGGHTIVASLQGVRAAQLGKRLLHGESPRSISVEEKSPSLFLFDHSQLRRFKLKDSDVPRGSRILNRPQSFYATHRVVIWIAAPIIAVLSILVVLLSISIRRRRRAEEVLRESEHRFRSFIENAQDVIFSISPEGYLTYVCPKWQSNFGVPAEEALGHHFTRYVHPDDVPVCHDHLLKNSSPSTLSSHVEFRFQGADGSWRWHVATLSPLRNSEGQIRSLVGIARDMTERNKFIEAMQRAERLDSLGVLAGGIAHDFNNLLGGLFGFLDMALKENTIGPKARGYIENAISVYGRAKDLTQQILNFAKGGVPQFRTGDVTVLVKKCASFILSGSPTIYHIESPAQVWACDFDEHQIAQVIDNMLINAQQAMSGGGAISIEVSNLYVTENKPEIPKGNYVQICIRDTGSGIEPGHFKLIFDPFFTTKPKGTGLGLATCYSIVRKHKGTIEVESTRGVGSTFRVLLPASQGCSVRQPIPTSASAAGTGRVLVMDDDDSIRELACEMLRKGGYAFSEARDGAEALKLFTEAQNSDRPFLAALFDLTVREGMSGREAIDELRKLSSQFPVIATSGYSDDPIMSNPQDFGFSASIAKPFRLNELLTKLKSHAG